MHFQNELYKTVIFRGKVICMKPSEFDQMVRFRDERIKNRQFYNDGHKTTDFFAERGIDLEGGGEVCPHEMGVMIFPRSEFCGDLEMKFGKGMFSYEGWYPQGQSLGDILISTILKQKG